MAVDLHLPSDSCDSCYNKTTKPRQLHIVHLLCLASSNICSQDAHVLCALFCGWPSLSHNGICVDARVPIWLHVEYCPHQKLSP